MRRVLVVVLLGVLGLVLGLPVDADFKPTLSPDGSVVKFSAASGDVLQIGDTASQTSDFVGGFGKAENNVLPAAPSRPMTATLLQVDEAGNNDGKPCDECLLHKIEVPEGFSGDLNELAEAAYEPDESMMREAMATATRADEDEDQPQVLHFGMRPGDELIGGFGKEEDTTEKPADSTQINLEFAEGFDQSSQIHDVKHKTEVLEKDIVAKNTDADTLEHQVASLEAAKSEHASRIAELRTSGTSEVEATKQSLTGRLESLDQQYQEAVDDLRSQTATRLKRVREETQRIGDRKISAKSQGQSQKRAELTKMLQDAKTQLSQLQKLAADSETRALKLKDGKHSAFGVTNAAQVSSGSGVRSQLAQTKDALERLRQHVDEEEAVVGELGTRVREEQHAKMILDARLKNLHMREEAVANEEKDLEAANANLHHDLDKGEFDQETEAQMVANAREALRSSLENADETAESQVVDEEHQFQSRTMEAAKAEIERLKVELAQQQAKVTHAEQVVIAQEGSIHTEVQQADNLARDTNAKLAQAQAQVEDQLERANALAQDIINEANNQAATIREREKAITLDGPQATALEQVDKAQLAETQHLLEEERQAKAIGAQAREHEKQQKEEKERLWKERLEGAENELRTKLQADVSKDLEQLSKASAAQMNDLNADWVMAKIRADKDAKELADLKAEHEKLVQMQLQVKSQLEHQKSEWEFQQAVASQNAL